MQPSHALIYGLRRAAYEPQLTQALAAVFVSDARLGSEFVQLLLRGLGRNDLAAAIPLKLDCAAEEIVADGRLDLRFRGDEWDIIVELKIHAGYGPGWFERYVKSLTDAKHRYVAAITRDVPGYGEPPAGSNPKWLGSTRWRTLLPEMRTLEPSDAALAAQWPLFLDVLEQEGSMGFTKADPALFDAYGQTKRALDHMEEFVRALQIPLVQALGRAAGGDEQAAGLYWKSGRRLGRTRWGRISVPFRVPADAAHWRVRAGVISWHPPASFFVQAAPDQRWDRRAFSREARAAVDQLVRGQFEPKWMAAYLQLDQDLVSSPQLEEGVLAWAYDRFSDLAESGLLSLPIEELGDATAPDADTAES